MSQLTGCTTNIANFIVCELTQALVWSVGGSAAPFSYAIPRVVFAGTFEEMIKVHTRRIVALMQDLDMPW